MIDTSCAILNERSIKASLSLTNALLNMTLVLSHQSLYQSQSTSLSNTNTNTNTKTKTNIKTKRRRFKNDDEDQEEARVSEGVVGEGGRYCSLFLHRLLLVCLLGVSRVSCVRASYLHLLDLSSLELGASPCRCVRVRD